MIMIDEVKNKEIVLQNGDYFRSLIFDIHQANLSIDLETYIFANDEIGFQVALALMEAARRGVKVRVLLDGFGSMNFNKELKENMEKAGILVKYYHPFFTLLHWPREGSFIQKLKHSIKYFNYRNHRKTCVIDEKIAYVGSANISKGVNISGQLMEWYDVTLRMTEVSLSLLTRAFNKAWNCIGCKKKLKNKNDFNADFSMFRLNNTWRLRRKLYKDILARIKFCKKRIFITNAYFIPKKYLLMKLIQAANRGVEITIVVPGKPDVIGASLLTHSFFSILLASGINIFRHNKGILHAKILILDDWYCLGSSNINHRSLKYDLEVDVVVSAEAAKKEIEAIFQDYCNNSNRVQRGNIHLSLLEKIAIFVLNLFKKFS